MTRKCWKQLGRSHIQTKSSHDMHRRSQALPAKDRIESPVTYTKSRNAFIKLITCLNYCLDEIRYLQRVPV